MSTSLLVAIILLLLSFITVLEFILAPCRPELDPDYSKVPKMIHQLTLLVDDADYEAIHAALLYRRDWNCVPDAEPGSSENGVLMAEICRGWMERCDYEWPHPDQDPDFCAPSENSDD